MSYSLRFGSNPCKTRLNQYYQDYHSLGIRDVFGVGLNDVDNKRDVVAGINDRCPTGNALGDAGMEMADFTTEGTLPHYGRLLENRRTVRLNLMYRDSRKDTA